jgi:hypothetical protein
MTFRQDFPEVKFELTAPKQLEHVVSEIIEAKHALIYESRERFLLELVDVVHSTYNTMYKAGFTDAEICKAIADVRENNRVRGKYG